jgi:hypothetical protein
VNSDVTSTQGGALTRLPLGRNPSAFHFRAKSWLSGFQALAVSVSNPHNLPQKLTEQEIFLSTW